MSLPAHYFDTGAISEDDDEHRAQVAAGRIPAKCRLAGPTLKLIDRYITPRSLTFCAICPFPSRELCGGLPKNGDSPIKAELEKINIGEDSLLTRNAGARITRDVARSQLEDGLKAIQAARTKGK
jgi:hypothetical protein